MIFFKLKEFLNKAGKEISEDHLLQFDYKVFSFLFISSALFILLVIFKIHGSSIPYWNNIIHSDKKEGLILGNPRLIRDDEWGISTPYILSQCARNFPLENESFGTGKAPLCTNINLPVYHYITMFRIQNWGFFFMDLERAYSFHWNYKTFGLLISFFLLLMLLTENNFFLSLFGTAWIYLTSMIQWWFSTNSTPEMITSFSVIFISSVYILSSRKKHLILFSLLLFILFSVNFLLCLYPPYQIPAFYLLIFLLTSYLFKHFKKENFKSKMILKIICLIAAIIIPIIIICSFYIEAGETITIMRNTFYPGKRISSGADLGYGKYLSGFYDIYYSEANFPRDWLNVCEASNFIFLFPVVLFINLKNLLSRKKNDIMEISLLVYIIVISIWVLYGIPPLIAKLTLLNRVPGNRALYGLGIANIILTIIFLNNKNSPEKEFLKKFGIPALMIIILIIHGLYLKSLYEFFNLEKFFLICILFGIISYLMANKKTLLFSTGIIILVLPNYLINPFSIGLSPIFEKELTRVSREIYVRDREAKWVVFGDERIANFLKSTGINIFNGTKYIPDLKTMKNLDPELKYEHIYNRFGYIKVISTENKPHLEDLSFSYNNMLDYSIYINPSSEKLNRIGIKYLVFTYTPLRENLSALIPVEYIKNDNIYILKNMASEKEEGDSYKTLMEMMGMVFPPISSTTPLLPETLFSIESINNMTVNEEPLILKTDNTITIKGWAIDERAQNIAGGVYIDIDGKTFPALYGFSRPDIAGAFRRPSYNNCGFERTIPVSYIGSGIHKLSIKILTIDGISYYNPEKEIVFEIR